MILLVVTALVFMTACAPNTSADEPKLAVQGSVESVEVDGGTLRMLVKAADKGTADFSEAIVIVDTETGIGSTAQKYDAATDSFAVSDKLNVYYNGVATKSNPPQLTAVLIERQ